MVVFPVPWPPARPRIKGFFLLTLFAIQKHDGIKKEMLFGYESNENFVHITDLEIYKRLTKNN